jgi:hypothetical protein
MDEQGNIVPVHIDGSEKQQVSPNGQEKQSTVPAEAATGQDAIDYVEGVRFWLITAAYVCHSKHRESC